MTDAEHSSIPDPVVEAYKAGVDRTLLRENLRRSVSERLENLSSLLRFAEAMRGAARPPKGKP